MEPVHVVLGLSGLIISLVAHTLTRNFVRAVLVTIIGTILACSAFIVVQPGYSAKGDKFLLIAIGFVGLTSFAVSAAVGLAFVLVRRLNE